MSEAQRKIPQADYASIVARHASGVKLAVIAREYGVSGEGIRRIIKKVDSSKIGVSRQARADRSRIRFLKYADDRCMKSWGMHKEEFDQHVLLWGALVVNGSPLQRFVAQRKNARSRSISWELTFVEWWQIWHESGKWDRRGCRPDDFVMARRGDLDTPYSKETVFICTSLQNLHDGFISTPGSVRHAKRRVTLALRDKEA